MAKTILTVSRLREVLHYEPDTGLFTREFTTGGEIKGCIAGGIDRINGYLRISVNGTSYKAHRLAWFYMTGAWPLGVIDHINGDKLDNRFCNLRDATHQINNQNIHAAGKRTTSGLRGVSWLKSRKQWRSTIFVDGKSIHLGFFGDKNEAHAAYKAAKKKLHGCALPPGSQ